MNWISGTVLPRNEVNCPPTFSEINQCFLREKLIKGDVAHNHIGKPAGGNASQGRGEAYALDGSSKNGCRKLNKKCDSPFTI